MPFNLPNITKTDLYSGKDNWMTRRIRLFSRFTLPSFKNQTDEDFHLLLIIDPNTPSRYKSFFSSLEDNYNFIHIIHSEESQGEDFEGKVLSLYNSKRKNKSNIILASRCDNDDCVHTFYNSTIKNSIGNYNVLSLAKGLYWDISSDTFLSSVFPTGPFVTIRSTFENFINPRYTNHHDVVNNNESRILSEGLPMWIQVIHGENLWNRLDRIPGELCKVDKNNIQEHFNFSLDE